MQLLCNIFVLDFWGGTRREGAGAGRARRYRVAGWRPRHGGVYILALSPAISEGSILVKPKHFLPRSLREAPIRYSSRSSMTRKRSFSRLSRRSGVRRRRSPATPAAAVRSARARGQRWLACLIQVRGRYALAP